MSLNIEKLGFMPGALQDILSSTNYPLQSTRALSVVTKITLVVENVSPNFKAFVSRALLHKSGIDDGLYHALNQLESNISDECSRVIDGIQAVDSCKSGKTAVTAMDLDWAVFSDEGFQATTPKMSKFPMGDSEVHDGVRRLDERPKTPNW